MSESDNALNSQINCDRISLYDLIRNFCLDTEQRSVCDQLNRSNSGMFYINALAGVGKTSLINAILFGAAMNYKRPEHKNKVVLVLVPSRELRYDLCQDVLNTGVFDDTEVLWLGRPPPGRTDGLWEDRLADSMRELQKDTLQNLDNLKAQLKLALEEVEEHALGNGKYWNYILDSLLNRPTDSTFLKALNLAKKDLKRHIVCEVCEFIGQHGELLELLGEPVKLVLATADAFCQVRCASFLSGRLSNLASEDNRGGRV